MPLRISFAVVALVSLVSHPGARTWNISPDGSGDAPTIQAGIDSAAAGDTVSLTDGTFAGEGNRNIDFSGKAIVVRSGSGDAESCIIDCEGEEIWWSVRRGFLFASGEDSESVLESIQIINGWVWREDGGAILITNSSPTIRECILTANTAYQRNGGGLWARGSPLVTGCTITDNSAGGVGGASFEAGSPHIQECDISYNHGRGIAFSRSGSPHIQDCDISYNDGRGITFSRSAPHIENCTISHNSDGGLSIYLCSGVAILSCSLSYNTSSGNGGGASYTAPYDGGGFEFRNCVFESNSTTGNGGGVYISTNSLMFFLLNDCRFVSNEASGSGGGIFIEGESYLFSDFCSYIGNSSLKNGGAIAADNDAIVVVDTCLVSANESSNMGGGFYCRSERGILIHGSTLHGNSAPYGAGICADTDGSFTVAGTIIAFNNGTAAWCESADAVELSCSDLYGNTGGDWIGCIEDQADTNGNFSTDPLFCDPGSGDFSLDTVSPCLDAPGCGLVGAFGEGCDIATGIAAEEILPERGYDFIARPNPSRGEVTIHYAPARNGSAVIFVYDIRGRLVRSLGKTESPGTLTWDGTDHAGDRVSPGVYFLRIESAGGSGTKRVVLLR